MKKANLEKTFLEELSKISNISIACEKVGLSRQTVYRWMNVDQSFRLKVKESLNMGNESINDLAESKLVSHIKQGSMRAIEYWLSNHKYNYLKPKPKDFWTNTYKQNEKELGGMFIIDMNGRIDYIDETGIYKTKLKKNSSVFEELENKYRATIFEIADMSKKENISNIMES